MSPRYPRVDPVGGSAVIASHKYRRHNQPRAATMDTNDANDEHDELTDADDVLDESMDDEADYRERAATKLDQIAQQVKQALADAAISLDVFLVVPGSGDAIVTFGTVADPDPNDDEWQTVAAIVASVVRRAIGLNRSRCRSLVCATTRDQESHNAIA
jgi:hypothetical protein